MEFNFNEEKLDDSTIQQLHLKVLKIMCPSKEAALEEQKGYYNYYCHYYYTEEEEHKLEAWTKTVDNVFWNMTKRLVIDETELLKILVVNDKNFKSVKQIVEILETRKVTVRASKIFNGMYYKGEEQKSTFWGVGFFKKAKDLFMNTEIEEDEVLSQQTRKKIVCCSYLEYITKQIMHHVAFEEITPIITHKKFQNI